MSGCFFSTGFVVLAQEIQGPPPKIEQPMERPYGQIFQMMKPMECNDTKVIKDYIKGSSNQDPLAYGLNYNYMGWPNLLTTLPSLSVSGSKGLYGGTPGGINQVILGLYANMNIP